MILPSFRVALAPAALWLLVCSGCATWHPVERHESWTLYVKEGETVDLAPFKSALAPAFEAVEERLGAFDRRVKIHAWGGNADLEGGKDGELFDREGKLEHVPGIGPARVRAFHVRGSGAPFSPSGVFLGTAEAGTAVHELVHARLAELGADVPLWFEEGLATLWGDGVLFGGRWVVDGLSCWPMRVLRDERLPDNDLERLLGLTARDSYTARENLLMHFVGWAILFDLYREAPDAIWEQWLQAFRQGARRTTTVDEARLRLERTLRVQTERTWLKRLSDPDPGIRLGAAKATWKLHSHDAVDCLLDALAVETDPEVRFGLALNAMLAVGEIRVGRGTWRRFSRLVDPPLREAHLPNPGEQIAAEEFYVALRSRRRSTQSSLDRLSHYWEE